jgi:hypothetical protein
LTQLAPAELRAIFVAQIFNLLYRRIAFCETRQGTGAPGIFIASYNAIQRSAAKRFAKSQPRDYPHHKAETGRFYQNMTIRVIDMA